MSSYVYIMANYRNGTLYVGSTKNLVERVWQHKNKIIPGFTATYSLNKLIYFEEHENIVAAAMREKKIKNRNRKWKLALVEKENPSWKDLFEDICG